MSKPTKQQPVMAKIEAAIEPKVGPEIESKTEHKSAPMPLPRTVTLLGATGSIGSSTVDLLRREPGRYAVEAVTAHRNAGALARLARELGARLAAIADASAFRELKAELAGSGIEAAAGEEAIVEAAQRPADWVMAAITGAASLAPTLAAAERGATVALANKECLVCAGGLFMRRAAANGAMVLPVDSEHNAIFQALSAGRRDDIRRIILTASGGPFRTLPLEAIRKVTVEQALKHPTWSMGPKVTIDSATLMNKGLELIEAHHLFGLTPGKLDVVVHPQSIVHGLVEFRDGSVIAQLGSPDMRIPISHCLAWPVRMGTPAPRLDLARLATLTFEEPDTVRFPALKLARQALAAGGAAPTVLNAANEIAVREFVAKRLDFGGIPALVEATLELAQRRGETAEPQSVDEALRVDHNARTLAANLLPEIAAMAS
jgi:1-deoxy-D-xylulose-5-phosphate reductoisomerase